jgi:hypothetical protein
MTKKVPINCSHGGRLFERKNGGREKQCSTACRFWSKVGRAESGCWEWQWSVFKQTGYGQFALDSKTPVNAHRMSWELVNGTVPSGSFVLHKCDNRKCVNPEHLFLGNQQDNMEDMAKKGRHVGTKGWKATDLQRIARAQQMKNIWQERRNKSA